MERHVTSSTDSIPMRSGRGGDARRTRLIDGLDAGSPRQSRKAEVPSVLPRGGLARHERPCEAVHGISGRRPDRATSRSARGR